MCIKDGRLTGAQMVDHIVPIKRGGAQLDMNNLQSLCNACHNKKTANE
ncbi:HNH endonuclease [Peribacillus asahii]|nr:HNH endonuclease [Peribacillus asahii]